MYDVSYLLSGLKDGSFVLELKLITVGSARMSKVTMIMLFIHLYLNVVWIEHLMTF